MMMNHIWNALRDHHAAVEGRSILGLFDSGDRAAGFTARLALILLIACF